MAKKTDYDAMLKQLGKADGVVPVPVYTKGLSRAEWEIVWDKGRMSTSILLRHGVIDKSWIADKDCRPRTGNGYHMTAVYRPAKGWKSGLMQAAIKKLKKATND